MGEDYTVVWVYLAAIGFIGTVVMLAVGGDDDMDDYLGE